MKNISEVIGERLKRIRNEAGLSQSQLAKLCGWAQSRVGNYEVGTRAISAEDAIILSGVLGVTPAYLLFGGDDVQKPITPAYEYPLFTTVQAGAFSAVDGQYMEKDAKKWISTSKKASDRSFWLEVEGNSMTAPPGGTPSFPAGIYILIDPEEAVNPGDFCVAGIDNGSEVTFKRLAKDAGEFYLEPLNPSFRMLPFSENCHIIGKVVSALWMM
ncbi:LexA family protein [Yersinia proxima]|uniref:LexA family protein n=1 Tax=Yersinia proxima TaxID=2890316 RepID=UPI001D0F9DAC|nr:LexA family transcriptional regulator [Yersinia proxima]